MKNGGNLNCLVKAGDPPPRSVVVLRALQLGDLLCAIPAFRALRAALPQARIALMGLPLTQTFVDRFKRYLDEFIDFPGYPGLPEQAPRIHRFPGFLASMRQRQFDVAIQMQGNGSISNPLVMLLGAQVTAGFFPPGGYCPDLDRFFPYPEQEPEVRRHLHLMQFLGIPSKGEELEFALYGEDLQALGSMDESGYLQPGEYVCIHPGARAPARRWLPERFAVVADRLARQGLRVVLTGNADEAGLAQAVAGAMKSGSLDLSGRTSLGTLAATLSGARLLVCNDTGISHLAAALRVPSVVVFTASDPSRWAPLDRKRHRPVHELVPCRPCTWSVCPGDHHCATAVSTESVLAQAELLLRKEYAGAA